MCVCVPLFIHPSIYGPLGCFHIAIVNNAAGHVGTHISCLHSNFISLDIYIQMWEC